MERTVIEEPQLSYLLELFTELGDASNDFILAGAQAMRFVVDEARYTRDFDFVLNVISIRQITRSIGDILTRLGYEVVPTAMRFQFTKAIPNSPEIMRIEFLAPERDKRPNAGDIRVDVQPGLHARACKGAEILLRESDRRIIKGKLPGGKPVEVSLRVACSHALVMLKLLAMDDRYRNIRGRKQAEHDRNEARIHAGDIVSIVRSCIENPDFRASFHSQFGDDYDLRDQVLVIVSRYFADSVAPGIQLYAEFLSLQGPGSDRGREERALREVRLLLSGPTR